ncbi:hypothetical protein [Saccharopolyspora hordei]|uniref:Uncharacterized protein n=1 Tax=Saccharopolyspora hordei TaxID=1838 RepID=A0A853AUT9_9PSEU|nr:hypothetical protein [Saccharopolyspora hordei]NYI86414.1 hypothetical protein [Saccharopolyspora hordei]
MYQDMEPSADELAFCEANLDEWDQLRVRDYWEAVVTAELGAPMGVASVYRWSAMGPGEHTRIRRQQRRTDNRVLRLIATTVDNRAAEAPNLGEAA